MRISRRLSPRRGAVHRWPLLAASGIGERGGSVFAFPLHQGAIRVGTLDLCIDTVTVLDQAGFTTAVQIADLLTVILLAGVRARPRTAGDNGYPTDGDGSGPWWEAAASTREIHQATGMVAVQLGVDIADAYARIVAYALTEGLPLALLAAEVIAHRITFSPNGSGPEAAAP